MCGIFGYANYMTKLTKREISNIITNGLKRIEYRGYDSAGMTLMSDDSNKNVAFREVGKVDNLVRLIQNQKEVSLSSVVNNHVGIAHTRWATHGNPFISNTHPLSSDDSGKFMCVHNGIITNFKELKELLISKGFSFYSETDTEVAAKLALLFYQEMSKDGEDPTFVEVVKKVATHCTGAFALVFVSSIFPCEIVAVRRCSPLLVGIKTSSSMTMDFLGVSFDRNIESSVIQNHHVSPFCSTDDLRLFNQSLNIHPTDISNSPIELFLASDASAIVEHTKKVIYLEDDDLVHVANGNLKIHRLKSQNDDNNKSVTRQIHTIDMKLTEIMKGNFEYFMLKEIFEQPESVTNTIRGRVHSDPHMVSLEGIQEYIDIMKSSRRIILIACGTSYHSCLAVRSLMEELVGIPVQVEISSEFTDRRGPVSRFDTCIFVSQSGETADTILAMRYCLKRNAFCIGITNTVGSTISREACSDVHINAGPEIGVASTKAYTSQFVTLVMIALILSQDSICLQNRREEIIKGLFSLGSLIKEALELNEMIKELSYQKISGEKSITIIGRGYQYATCLEAALKIKELNYIPAEGVAAGELKHGTIAVVDDSSCIIAIVSDDRELEKSKNAVLQILARGGKPYIVCPSKIVDDFKGFKGLKFIPVPSTVDCLQGLISVIPMQLLAYHMAVAKGHNVDCPRNLAKSVTVE